MSEMSEDKEQMFNIEKTKGSGVKFVKPHRHRATKHTDQEMTSDWHT